MSDLSDAFVERYGADLFDDLCEGVLSPEAYPHVRVTETERHNACNHTYRGEIVREGQETVYYSLDSGDWNGTYLRYFSEEGPEDYERGYRVYVFDLNPSRLTVPVAEVRLKVSIWLNNYLSVTMANGEFKDKERGYGYDSTFAPGVVTDKHYRDYAASRDLIPASAWIPETIERVSTTEFNNARIEYEKAADIRYRKQFRDKVEPQHEEALSQRAGEFFRLLAIRFASEGRENAAALAKDVSKAWLDALVDSPSSA
ncbi:hypothetical protein HOU02_gp336 [Caulobacter phage CcrBL9]|uniref:Uncharacterized protein n=1 Tax=Caulobacter phage CcrBL9 TaxID=2283270 RepID=A0A385EFD6_9CAUD|nr:hypothetical protein HOU02_gp336 [Caulobacter phage CcrBL9]AXQ69389.1 hypothetical protein CcrBL9_gp365 [Caulobacter phage CcrBL9]